MTTVSNDDFADLARGLDRVLAPSVERLSLCAQRIAPSLRRARYRRIIAACATLLVVGTGTAVTAFGTTVRVGGLEINLHREATSPAVPMTIPGNVTQWPGDPVTEVEAKRRFQTRIRLPRVLAAPRSLFWMTPPRTGTVTAVWSPSHLLPKMSDPKVGMLFSQFRGSARADPIMAKKSISVGGTVESITVGKQNGWWISGPLHVVEIIDESGTRTELPRLAGNTLVWTDNLYTYRLEGNVAKAVALRIARSVG